MAFLVPLARRGFKELRRLRLSGVTFFAWPRLKNYVFDLIAALNLCNVQFMFCSGRRLARLVPYATRNKISSV
jgi:hypothetical protein